MELGETEIIKWYLQYFNEIEAEKFERFKKILLEGNEQDLCNLLPEMRLGE